MARKYKSPFDNKVFNSVGALEEYVKKYYKNKIPSSYKGDIDHYLFDYRNGFKGGKCQICGAPTKWDPEKKRYKILCEPTIINRIKNFFRGRLNSCQEIMRKNYLENIKRVYNTDNLMNSIEYQEMLLKNRRIAKEVKFKGNVLVVIGSYEEEFVKQCDKVLTNKNDLQAPGPTVQWVPKGSYVPKQTITDFYIKSIDCIVSIKDEGFGNEDHPHIKKKRLEDAYKFKGIVENKHNYKAVVELNGIEEIKDWERYYKEIKASKGRYIKYPNYYKKYVTD